MASNRIFFEGKYANDVFFEGKSCKEAWMGVNGVLTKVWEKKSINIILINDVIKLNAEYIVKEYMYYIQTENEDEHRYSLRRTQNPFYNRSDNDVEICGFFTQTTFSNSNHNNRVCILGATSNTVYIGIMYARDIASGFINHQGTRKYLDIFAYNIENGSLNSLAKSLRLLSFGFADGTTLLSYEYDITNSHDETGCDLTAWGNEYGTTIYESLKNTNILFDTFILDSATVILYGKGYPYGNGMYITLKINTNSFVHGIQVYKHTVTYPSSLTSRNATTSIICKSKGNYYAYVNDYNASSHTPIYSFGYFDSSLTNFTEIFNSETYNHSSNLCQEYLYVGDDTVYQYQSPNVNNVGDYIIVKTAKDNNYTFHGSYYVTLFTDDYRTFINKLPFSDEGALCIRAFSDAYKYRVIYIDLVNNKSMCCVIVCNYSHTKLLYKEYFETSSNYFVFLLGNNAYFSFGNGYYVIDLGE